MPTGDDPAGKFKQEVNCEDPISKIRTNLEVPTGEDPAGKFKQDVNSEDQSMQIIPKI